jgi:L-arabinokinase
MKILYYLTAHGYGHAVRSCAICKEFSRDVRVIFRTLIPRKFFEEELGFPFDYFPGQFDCGCIQRDSVTIHIEETLKTYRKLADQNEARLRDEVKWCQDQRVEGIVGDIPPFAFQVARTAGLPSIAVSNFTWYDIYEPYVKDCPGFKSYLQKIRQQYEMADLALELTPSTGMPYFKNRWKVPLVGNLGRNIRHRLKNHLGLERGKHLALIYHGEFGMDSVSWGNLEKFTDWDFIGIYPIPGEPANYHLVKKENFPYLDLVASVEVMISKIGYGIFAQSLLNGTPLIYLPRDDFAEFPVLEKAMVEWGHGYCLSREDYCGLNWEEVLTRVITRERPKPQTSDGAKVCAREIENFLRHVTQNRNGSPAK